MNTLQRLERLNRKLTAFAYGDNIVSKMSGSSSKSIASVLGERASRAGRIRAARYFIPVGPLGIRNRNNAARSISSGFASEKVIEGVRKGGKHPSDLAIERVLARKR